MGDRSDLTNVSLFRARDRRNAAIEDGVDASSDVREVGVSGVLLAAAVGHDSETTTNERYAGRAAVAQAAVDRVVGTLS